MATEDEESSSVPRRRLSCATCFDALWFCYWMEKESFGRRIYFVFDLAFLEFAPVHQMQQYYRLGVLDNCSGKWSALVDCLTLKTKRASEVQEILENREKGQHHIWTFRTPQEASSHWKGLFGHLDKPE